MTKTIFLPIIPVAGKPIGRHIRHDPRSLAYLVAETSTVTTKIWHLDSGTLDQGNVGACTGNALVDTLGTDPYYGTFPAGTVLDERLALEIYSEAEKIDGGEGYPPEDKGSSGLSAAQAAKARGLISGYLHITSVAAAHTAIQSGPFMVGTYWYTGMDSPDATGVVQATGTVRGGHEYECYGYDAETDLWWFRNSWGPTYGIQGNFAYDTATFTKLLAAHGDATVLVPRSEPAPTPTPAPAGDPVDAALNYEAAIFVARRHTGENETMAKALVTWRAGKGYSS